MSLHSQQAMHLPLHLPEPDPPPVHPRHLGERSSLVCDPGGPGRGRGHQCLGGLSSSLSSGACHRRVDIFNLNLINSSEIKKKLCAYYQEM